MKLHQLALAVSIAALPVTGAFAAALDRSGQPMNAFFQEGNYFEAGLSVLDPTVSGKEANNTPIQNGGVSRNVDDMGNSYIFPTAALKLQPHEKVSVALLYDQPFGANAEYSGNNKFAYNQAEANAVTAASVAPLQNAVVAFLTNINSNPALVAANGGTPYTTADIPRLAQSTALSTALPPELAEKVTTQAKQIVASQTTLLNTQAQTAKSSVKDYQGTHVDVHTETLSLVVGYQPTKNWNVYAGPVYQHVKADVNLRGTAYSVLNGYDLSVNQDGAVGWLAGMAYSKPEIALRAAVTYRSEIEHDLNAKENLSGNLTDGSSKLATPQSVNLDLQSGVAPDTLAFVNVRWVDWSSFKFQPHKFGQVSRLPVIQANTGKPEFNLVEYSKDQISATVGMGRKFNDKWSGSAAVGWDSGAGDPVSVLGPTKGYWNLGLGVQYSPQKNYFISGGVKHFWLGDVKAQTGAQAGTSAYSGEFTDNKAWAYGLKIGYKF